MSRIAWINPGAGVAGDMLLAALIDAGADIAAIRSAISALGVDGIDLRVERTSRAGIASTRVDVHTTDTATHRSARDIAALIDNAELPLRVAQRAAAVFCRLADVEGELHGVDPADVEFHEVGALDSIADIVGVCAALDDLDVDDVVVAPVGLGTGPVRSSHGIIPGPAPATMALLAGAGIDVRGIDTELETATPTGAALLATLATSTGSIPATTPSAVGYGAGSADPPDRANVVQVVIGDETGRTAVADAVIETLAVLDTNLDDVTGEVLAYTVARLIEAGARDAWTTSITMKKGRPAQQLSVLCDPDRAANLRALLVAETGTLGVRTTAVTRWTADREIASVDVDGQPIDVKRSAARAKAEFDDAAAAARTLGRPLRQVLADAIERVRPTTRRSTP
ncbi:MAG: nickel pincer cofactor biosynthesis protein LarC [Actinomycetota bacterium]